MEAQLKQLDRLATVADSKDGPARAAAESLAAGDLAKAEKALRELAKVAAEKPNDPQVREHLDRLKDEIRKAADNSDARQKLEKLVERAKKEGRDAEGLQKELDQLKTDAEKSKSLRDLADKLDAASQQMEKGDGAEAAKQLAAAAGAVSEIGDEVQAAQDAQAQVQRVEQLKAGANAPKTADEPGGPPQGSGGVADQPPPKGKEPTVVAREVRPRIPFDPKGATTPAGSGAFAPGFTKTDPAQLGPAVRQAMQSTPAATAGLPLAPDDRAAIRQFFERLNK
jgi:hypothetical protein